MAASLSRAEVGEARTLTRETVEMAMTLDPTALRLCIGRLSPALKDARALLPPCAERGTIIFERGDAEISDPATGNHDPRLPLPLWALIMLETSDPFAVHQALRLRRWLYGGPAMSLSSPGPRADHRSRRNGHRDLTRHRRARGRPVCRCKVRRQAAAPMAQRDHRSVAQHNDMPRPGLAHPSDHCREDLAASACRRMPDRLI